MTTQSSKLHSAAARIASLAIGAVVLASLPSRGTESVGGIVLEIAEFRNVPELDHDLVQFEAVFWDARDTVSLRRMIAEQRIAEGRTVLEIGTGTGLISLCCIGHGATEVVATDINPRAVANARYNALTLGYGDRLVVRGVSRQRPDAYSVIGRREKFDLIISNPPWEDGIPVRDEEFAFFDLNFQLLDSILGGLDQHLEEDGRALLAYGCVSAIRAVHRRAKFHGLHVEQLDDRELDALPELFLPGMLLEVRRESR